MLGGGVVADTTPPVDEGAVTVGVTILTDAGSELLNNFAEGAAVRGASSAEAGEVPWYGWYRCRGVGVLG